MLLSTNETKALANIACVEFITDESTPELVLVKTVKSVKPEPFVSEGKESELRAGNRILAQNMLEDILKGYNIKLSDVAFSPRLLALAQGGSCESGENGGFVSYAAPASGELSQRKRFTIRVYTEEKDCDGGSIYYQRFSYPCCVGTPCSLSFEDGEFTTPEYTFKSRAPSGSPAATVEQLDFLPVWVSVGSEIPASCEPGREFIACTAMSCASFSLRAGDSLMMTESGYVKITPEA